MGSTLTQPENQNSGDQVMEVKCALKVDSLGHYAVLVPDEKLYGNRDEALEFAKRLVRQRAEEKRYDDELHELVNPNPPDDLPDVGLHCTMHNHQFHKGPLNAKQIRLIQNCEQSFVLWVDPTDYLVLVGKPSNDSSTGVLGYVALHLIGDSRAQLEKAKRVYGAVAPDEKFIHHVSICGWKIRGELTSQQAREQVGLPLSDDKMSYEREMVFPTVVEKPSNAS